MTTPLFLLRCVQLGLSIRDLDLLTIGMVNDMYVESRNDGCTAAYVELASQADFELLFTGWGKVMTIRGSFEPHIWPVIQIESY